MGVTRARLERLADERGRVEEKMEDLKRVAEEENRDLNDYEQEHLTKYRERVDQLEAEIVLLAGDLERAQDSKDVSRLLRSDDDDGAGPGGTRLPARARGTSSDAIVYRSFAEYARDVYITKSDLIASAAAGPTGDVQSTRAAAEERLSRTLQNTTSSVVAGLLQPTHMTQIMDIIDASRPIVASGRDVPLDRGSLTYPKIDTRPTVVKQTSEKTEGGTIAPAISLQTVSADTYIGGGNISWQAINWSNPDVLTLWFDLAAEAYARQTENAAADLLEDAVGIGTVGTASGRLGTVGTEAFGAWRSAVVAGLGGIYTATNGRHRTDTLYLSANRFFQLAALGTDQVTQMSPVGNLDVGSMTGTFFGLRVVGSYGFDQDVAIVGDSSALLIGENAGNPVEMRVVEPSIGGMEVGLIGAFKAAVFDANRFYHLGTHL
jgi:HK97 family phage major capsid protein